MTAVRFGDIRFWIVLIGEVKSGCRLWGWAMAVTAVVIVLRLTLPSHEIREGHAVFFPAMKCNRFCPRTSFSPCAVI